MVQENARPGDPGWRIPPGAPGGIAGFADAVDATRGQRVGLYVSTAAASFHVEAYRMGFYGGTGARLVWTSGQLPGRQQPVCPRDPATNMVACDNWARSLTFTLDAAWLPGDYLLKLVGSGGQQGYLPLTVWDPASHATYLVKNDVLTLQAWNPYGGYDLYTGLGDCPPDEYPPCNRARVLSFDRPYATGRGAGDFLTLGLPLVQLMEQHGLDVSYVTDLTLTAHPQVALAHKVLISLGHDECWDLAERRAALAAEQHGVNLIFFGASAILRHVRAQPSPLGADRELVDYRDSSADPLDGHGDPLQVTGNTWASPPANWPANGFVGARYLGYLLPGAPPASFVVADGRSWLFAGTGVHTGSAVAGVLAAGDLDAFDPGTHPGNLHILGHSPIPAAQAQLSVTFGAVSYADMTYYTDPAGKAGVFDSGTTSWIPDLLPCARGHRCPAAFVQRVTTNLLHTFGQGPAGRLEPSRANWQSLPRY